MDASFSVTGLSEEFETFLGSGDFEGAEIMLAAALAAAPKLEAFIHFQYGRLYSKWNKLTSATHHLLKSVEVAKMNGDEMFMIQVLGELKAVKDRQASQKP